MSRDNTNRTDLVTIVWIDDITFKIFSFRFTFWMDLVRYLWIDYIKCKILKKFIWMIIWFFSSFNCYWNNSNFWKYCFYISMMLKWHLNFLNKQCFSMNGNAMVEENMTQSFKFHGSSVFKALVDINRFDDFSCLIKIMKSININKWIKNEVSMWPQTLIDVFLYYYLSIYAKIH